MGKGFYGYGILTKDDLPLMEGSSPIIDNEAKELEVIADMPGTAKMDIAPCRIVTLFWDDNLDEDDF